MLAEPMTTATDYALATWSAWLGLRLARLAWRTRRSSIAAWAAAFFCTAGGALLGGTWHGFAPFIDSTTRLALWLGTYVSIGAANFLLIAGVSLASAGPPERTWHLAAALTKLALLVSGISVAQQLRYVAGDVAVTLAVLVLFAARPRSRGTPCARFILAGVAVTVAGGIVQRAAIAPDPAFNHNDLFHVVQMAGLYLLYRGGRLLTDHCLGASTPGAIMRDPWHRPPHSSSSWRTRSWSRGPWPSGPPVTP
jgi:hypothetical protein